MAGGSFFQRVAQWLANEIIVKGLANSPAFQRFAVRSSQQAKEVSKSASEALKNISESENVSQLRKESQVVGRQARDFASALREEIEASLRADQRGPTSPPTPPRK